jgi:hypothetical protein
LPNGNGDLRRPNGQFGPGNKGRPPGIPSKKAYEIKEVARQIILGDDPEKSIAAMIRRIRSGQAEHLERFFLEHLYGKPKEHLNISLTQTHIAAVIELSDLALGEFLALMREKRHEEALKLLPGGQVA